MNITIPNISGGSYVRVYEDSLNIEIQKIKIFITEINKYKDNHIFYINQLRLFFKDIPVDFLYGDNQYQLIYDSKLINNYFKYLLSSITDKELMRLLKLHEPLESACSYKKVKNINNIEQKVYGKHDVKGGTVNVEHYNLNYVDKNSKNLEELCKTISVNSLDFLKLLDSKITKLTKTQQRLFAEVKSMYK
jgi:hypothetical protein